MPIKNVFLDLDDTLLDFGASEAEGLRKTLLSFGIDPTDEIVRRYSEINDAQWKALERGETTQAILKVERYRQLLVHLGRTDMSAEAIAAEYEKKINIYTLL